MAPLPSHPQSNYITVCIWVKHIPKGTKLEKISQLRPYYYLVATKIPRSNISFRNEASDIIRKHIMIPSTLDQGMINFIEAQNPTKGATNKTIVYTGVDDLVDRFDGMTQKLIADARDANRPTVHALLLITLTENEFKKYKEQRKFKTNEIFDKDYKPPCRSCRRGWFCELMSKVKGIMCRSEGKSSVKAEKKVVMDSKKKEKHNTKISCCVLACFFCGNYEDVSIA